MASEANPFALRPPKHEEQITPQLEPARPDADSVRVQRVVSLAARWREQSRELEHQFRLLRYPEAKIRAMALGVAFKNCADDIEAEWAGSEANKEWLEKYLVAD